MANYETLHRAMQGLKRSPDGADSCRPPTGSAPGERRQAVPFSCRCPISGELMVDPVLVADGHTYDRIMIEEWFSRGHVTSPLTGLRLPSVTMTSNHAVKSLIAEFVLTPGTRPAHPDPVAAVSAAAERQRRLSEKESFAALAVEIEGLRRSNAALTAQVACCTGPSALGSEFGESAAVVVVDDDDEEEEFFGFPPDSESESGDTESDGCTEGAGWADRTEMAGLLTEATRLWKLRQLEHAEQACRAAQSLCPASGPANCALLLGDILVEQGELDEAHTVFEQVLKREPSNARALTSSAVCLEHAGEIGPAIVRHRDAVKADPNDVIAICGLATALEGLGDQTGEIDLLRYQALAMSETARRQLSAAEIVVLADVVLGWCNDPAGAEAMYRRAFELDPGDVSIGLKLGRLLEAQGKFHAQR